MKKIGIYGGSFNPVHNGHIKLVNGAINELSLDKVIIVPCYIQPFKRNIIFDNSLDRINMLKLAFKSPKIEISTYEIDKRDISYTYDTLNHFKSIYPQDELIFILGTDSINQVASWYKGIELLKTYSFAFANRPDYAYEEINCDYKIIYEIKEVMPDISSTSIREMVKDNKDISQYVPDNVAEYIINNGLYKD